MAVTILVAAFSSAQAQPPVSPEWQKVIDTAKKEGSVTLYSSFAPSNLKALGDAFTKLYGVKVNVLRDVDTPLMTKVDAENSSKNPLADVLTVTDLGYFNSRGSKGWWAKPVGPNFDDPQFDRTKYLSNDGVFITGGFVYVVGWNTDAVPKGIRSYDDVLNPVFARKVGVVDPAVSVATVSFYDYLAERNGPKYIDGLAALRPQIFAGMLPSGQALTSGQVSVAIAVQALTAEKAQGAPVDYWVPSPAWGAAFRTGIIAASTHPNAAQLLANFMISRQGQELLGKNGVSVLPDVKGAVTSIKDLVLYDPTALKPEHVEAFRTEFKTKFTGNR
ncbi:ABC transporter substrate-binding protein [Paraburkholderia caribensis]|uniref:ABC transporter substrate-binding protein n=1 Tax=Paraburkholderia caribensis TaxID=75105 RepID=UPI001CC6E277|nr:extracellular solute-binding protein [Paraburkholderia caribensis]